MKHLGHNSIESRGKIIGVSINVDGHGNRIIIENGVSIHRKSSIVVSGDNNIVHIKKGTHMSEGGRIRIEGNGNKLLIGENSKLINVFFSMGDDDTNIEIGKDCLFSANVILRNWDNHSIVTVDNPKIRISKGESVVIGDHVWIGYGSTILKGVNIGHDSIVGTMSVVTRDVEPNTIVVGNPAKMVRDGISWEENWLKQSV